MSDVQLTARDLYRLRKARLLAQRAALRAQWAQHQFQELSLEMERRYDLLAKDAVLDVQTGGVTVASVEGQSKEVSRGPADDAGQGTP